MPDFIGEIRRINERLRWVESWVARNAALGVIQDRSIAGAKLILGAVGSSELADRAVTGIKIALAVVEGGHMVPGAALSNIGSGGIGAIHLAAGVALANLGTGNVGVSTLAVGAATAPTWALGGTSSPSMGAAFGTVPEMSVSTNAGFNRLALFHTEIVGSGGSTGEWVLNDGSADLGHSFQTSYLPAGTPAVMLTTFAVIPAGQGSGVITARGRAVGGTVTANTVRRSIFAVEFRR